MEATTLTAIIVPFGEPVELDTVGGKGLNLSRLYRAGFPVPPGFTITTAAYRGFVRRHGLADLIDASLQVADLGDTSSIETASERIRAGFAAHGIPGDVADAIRTAHAVLGHPPVAVRSSATAEDLPGLSFAGQQETLLNVVTDDALLAAVIRCWSSLWTARAIAYRAGNGIDRSGLSLAVVVQAMVTAEASGVLFTANPLTGKRDEVVIDATLGLGEALVSGQVEPDHIIIGPSGHILSKTLGRKRIAVYSREGGGTVARQEDAADRQALSDEYALALTQTGRRVAELLGGPQDIEWAMARGEIALLQARPITTLYPLPDGMPAEPLKTMLSFGAVQGMLDPMTPLGCDVIVAAMTGAGRIFGSRASVDNQALLWTAGERLWVDVSGLLGSRQGRRLTLAALSYVDPGARLALHALVDERRFPPPGSLRTRTALRIARAVIPMVVTAMRALLRPDRQRRRLVSYLEEMLAGFQAQLTRASNMTERLREIQRIVDDAFHFVIPRFVPRFGPAMGAYNLLTHLTAGLPAGTCDARVMMRGVPHNVTTEMDLLLWRTAQTIGADTVAAAQFRTCAPEILARAYLRGELAPVAQEATGQFLQRYGMRGFGEIDIGRRRWREEPLPILQTLCTYLEIKDADLAPGTVFERSTRAAEAEVGKLVAALRGTRFGRIKAAVARWAAGRMRSLIGLRETPKLTMMRVFGPIREALLSDGERLVDEGILSRADDVFFLYLRELEALASGECRDWATVAQNRRDIGEQEQRRRQIPRLLLSDGQAFYGGAVPSGTGDATEIQGDPVSPGAVEGVVHVVLDPRSAQLPPGAILVCRGTDPSWTPLFLAAGGLVMEVGGMMTHGAVVAREFGIPAVVGVHEATERLRTGQRVRVDGSTGRVTLLDE